MLFVELLNHSQTKEKKREKITIKNGNAEVISFEFVFGDMHRLKRGDVNIYLVDRLEYFVFMDKLKKA